MSERRHRISHNELPHVTEAIENQLLQLLEQRSRSHAAEHLFKLWWRIQVHREGRPDYPEPITWGVIEEHLGDSPLMVPLTEEVAV